MKAGSLQQCLSPQDKLAYHQRSSHALPPGLYLGYLKLCSAVDQIRVLVPEQLPNILCHVKIRSNPNISRWDSRGSRASLPHPALEHPWFLPPAHGLQEAAASPLSSIPAMWAWSKPRCPAATTASAQLLHPAHFCLLSFREEWEWLQKMASMEEPVPVESKNETSPNHLFQELQVAIKELMALVNIPLQEVRELRAGDTGGDICSHYCGVFWMDSCRRKISVCTAKRC